MPFNYLELGAQGVAAERAPTVVSAGAGDAGKIPGLDAGGRLDSSVLPVNIGADYSTTTAGEILTAGQAVYISATGTALRADANTLGKAAIGFVSASVAASASVIVYYRGTLSNQTGLTIGARYFLSDSVLGGVTLTPPVGTGKIVQILGYALNATSITFEADKGPTVRA